MSKPELNKNFIIKLQGQSFVKYEGLLDLAHQKGLAGISTRILQYPLEENSFMAVCEATVTTEDGHEFIDIGDAAPSSVNSMLTPHIIRMAATRAKARALRDLTNIGMTALDEVNIDDIKSGQPQKDAMNGDYNKLLMEAKGLEQKIIEQGKGQQLAGVTGGIRLTAIKDHSKLKTAMDKARQI